MSPNPNDPPQPFGGDEAPVFTKIVITDPHVTKWQSEEKASKTIHAYWDKLAGAPGEATGGVERVKGGYRTRFTNGVIYLTTETSVCAWIYGAINEYYEKEGGPNSGLGLPTTDENPWADDGRFVTFTTGTVYWWPDTGAIALNNISVVYKGLICFGETDWDQSSDSDEPYAFISVAAGQNGKTVKTKIYGEPESIGGDGGDGVDGGETRQDYVPLYYGKPSGLGIYVNLMEHDFGQPEDYLPQVESAIDGAVTVIEFIPFFGPVLSIVNVFGWAEIIADVLDLQDDFIASDVVKLTPKETVVLAARPRYRTERGLTFTHETQLLQRDGASYKLYFEIKGS